MLENGHELLFWIDSLPCDRQNCIYLTPVETSLKRIKLTGGIPFLWKYDDEEVVGPNLFDDDLTYRVVGVDYRTNCIWVEEI